jgi:hypothetical protein
MKTLARWILLSQLVLASAATAQPATVVCDDELIRNKAMAILTPQIAPEEVADVIRRDNLRLAPDTTQTTAPSSSGGATSNADSPERPGWAAFAIEQGVAAENNQGGITIQLSPFDLLEQSSPENRFDDQGSYLDRSGMRRLTATLSLGNRGEAFDADGDGTVDVPASAKSITDSALLELQYRFYGTRDRREFTLTSAGLTALSPAAAASADYAEQVALVFANSRVADLILNALGDSKITSDGCDAAAAQVADAIRSDPALAARAGRVLTGAALMDRMVSDVVREFDSGWVWSIAGAFNQRDDYLGRDSAALSLRGLMGIVDPESSVADPVNGSTLVFNLDYVRERALGTVLPSTRAARLKAEYNGSFSSALARDTRWGLSVGAEKTWDAPAESRKSQAVVGLLFDVPIGRGVSIPFSLRWSNRNQLLQDEDEVIGNIGISFSFDPAPNQSRR